MEKIKINSNFKFTFDTDVDLRRAELSGYIESYDAERDAFIPPNPFASWQLNESSCTWEPPTPYPTDVGTLESPKRYVWDEETLAWTLVEATPA